MAHVNIWLRGSLHRKAKILSVIEDTSLSDFLTAAIQEAVDRDKVEVRDLLS